MNEVLMIVMAAGAVLGGFDRLRGNKWGFGDKFETGFMLLGSMALSMVGMICIAPVLAQWLGNVRSCPCTALSAWTRPCSAACSPLTWAATSWPWSLPRTRRWAGVVASIFGCTLVSLSPGHGDDSIFAKGIMLGLVAMPVGLVAGGLLSGLWGGAVPPPEPAHFRLGGAVAAGAVENPNKMIKGFMCCRRASAGW